MHYKIYKLYKIKLNKITVKNIRSSHIRLYIILTHEKIQEDQFHKYLQQENSLWYSEKPAFFCKCVYLL